jgi:hypothetical protein
MEMKSPKIINPDRNSLERKIFEIKRRFSGEWIATMNVIWVYAQKTKNPIDYFLEALKINMTEGRINKTPEEINLALESLRETLSKNPVDLNFPKAVDLIAKMMAEGSSLEEIENLSVKRNLEKGHVELSRGLMYGLTEEGKEVELHVPNTFFENNQMFLKSFIAGLKVLAKKLRENPELKDVEHISGFSMLVKDNPEFFSRLGFEIENFEDEENGASVVMSREKFLKLYGSENDK